MLLPYFSCVPVLWHGIEWCEEHCGYVMVSLTTGDNNNGARCSLNTRNKEYDMKVLGLTCGRKLSNTEIVVRKL